MNDQNRYRGSSSQRNQGEGRNPGWGREDESSQAERGNFSRYRAGNREDRNQSFGQRGELYGRQNDEGGDDDRPFNEQDRDYRSGSSGYGRSRDYQGESSNSGTQGSYGEQDRFGGFGSGRDRDRNGAGSSFGSGTSSSFRAGSNYGSGSGSNYSSGSNYGQGSRYSSGGGFGSSGSNSSGWTGQSRSGSGRGWEESSYGSGVQGSSYSGRGPKGYTRSDERIREDVCERLSENDEVDASEIEVQVKDRRVTLTGTVQNRRMKHIAEDLAEAVSGVDDVDNRITVTKPLLKDIADRLTGNEGEQHYANSGTKNGATASMSGSSTSSSSASGSSTNNL